MIIWSSSPKVLFSFILIKSMIGGRIRSVNLVGMSFMSYDVFAWDKICDAEDN